MRTTAIFAHAFLDGLTGAGLFHRLECPPGAADDARLFRFAQTGLIAGFVTAVGIVGAYAYLAMHNHEEGAMTGLIALSVIAFGVRLVSLRRRRS